MNLKEIERLISADVEAMETLRAAQRLGLPDWWLGAGFVRNRVWDHLTPRLAGALAHFASGLITRGACVASGLFRCERAMLGAARGNVGGPRLVPLRAATPSGGRKIEGRSSTGRAPRQGLLVRKRLRA